MLVVRTILMVCVLSILALGQSESKNSYQKVTLKDLVSRPADFQGQTVAIAAEVVSISADCRSVDVFDSQSKAMVGVSLSQLSKTQRSALVNEPIHRVTISGKLTMKNGRLTLKADKIVPLETTLVAER